MNPTKKSIAKKVAPRAAKKTSPKKESPGKNKKIPTETSVAVKEAPTQPSLREVRPAGKEHPKAAGISGIRIRLSAFDHRVLDEAAAKILDTAVRSGAVVHGPIPLPTKLHKFTVNKSTFVHKNSRDQYEMRIHRRLIDLTETTFKTVESLQGLSLPSGVDIEIKMK